MKVFIFPNVNKLTDSYHSGGGLVVIADTIEAATAEAVLNGVELTEKETLSAQVYELNGDPAKEVFIFPNAGCC